MIKKFVISIFNKLGYQIRGKRSLFSDFDTLHHDILKKVRGKTMTSPERIFSLIEAIRYVERNNIQGDIVECGVWKGGSMMAAALALRHSGNSSSRHLFLFDTFEGMSDPTIHDKNNGQLAIDILNKNINKEENLVWAFSPLQEVQSNISMTGYDPDKIHYIKGKVEDTIVNNLPGKIAVLRLDTDWYESTKCELENLYPLLVEDGVLIIDDYGYWDGAKKAVDEFFSKFRTVPFLSRIDETGRMMIKKSGYQ